MSEIIAQNLSAIPPVSIAHFDKGKADEFARRSSSEATRRAYARVVREFFAFAGNPHPNAIEHTQVRA